MILSVRLSRMMNRLRNLITDVPGLTVGNAHDAKVGTGVTTVLFDEPTVASGAVLGGAPANRDFSCLEPDAAVPGIDAVVLSGGSGFGLDAASGVQAFLREQQRGFLVGRTRVPIVPQAIVFDLLNNGDKEWGRYPPYRELGYAAASACSEGFDLGTVGGGYGATTFDLKGGLGSASTVTSSGYVVGSLVIVNAIGSAVIGGGPHFWAAPFEEGEEFGGLGMPQRVTPAMRSIGWKGGPQLSTTIALVATDAALTKAQAKRLAIAAHTGIAKALRLALALYDGDTVIAAATGRQALRNEAIDLIELAAVASDCLARAIARGVYEATALPYDPAHPAWKDKFAPIR